MYQKVHFHINAGYVWGKGISEEQCDAFSAEIKKLFEEKGWEIKESKWGNSCPSAYFGKSKLYLHPMEASGPIDVELIAEVEELLQKGTTFNYISCNRFEEVFDLSDSEYRGWLEAQRNEIEQKLLEAFKTPNDKFTVVEKVKEQYHLPRLTNYLLRCSDDVEWVYVESVCNQLIETGKIVLTSSIRSRYKTTKAALKALAS